MLKWTIILSATKMWNTVTEIRSRGKNAEVLTVLQNLKIHYLIFYNMTMHLDNKFTWDFKDTDFFYINLLYFLTKQRNFL